MPRSKSKKTVSQKVVGVATSSLPAPLQRAAGTRIGSMLLILLAPVLVATGIVTVTWEGGRPRFSLNRERAAEVEREAVDKLEELREEQPGERLRQRMAELPESILPQR